MNRLDTSEQALLQNEKKPKGLFESNAAGRWLRRNWLPLLCVISAVVGLAIALAGIIKPCEPTIQLTNRTETCNASCNFAVTDAMTKVVNDQAFAGKPEFPRNGCDDIACARRFCEFANNATLEIATACASNAKACCMRRVEVSPVNTLVTSTVPVTSVVAVVETSQVSIPETRSVAVKTTKPIEVSSEKSVAVVTFASINVTVNVTRTVPTEKNRNHHKDRKCHALCPGDKAGDDYDIWAQ